MIAELLSLCCERVGSGVKWCEASCDTGSDSVTKLGFRSALYHTYCLDWKRSPDISESFSVLGHAMSSCAFADVAPGYGALRVYGR